MSVIDEYLAELRRQLRLRPAEAALVVAEAEDHLRETVASALEAGLTQEEAELAAISAFGSVQAVVRAHADHPSLRLSGRGPAAVAAELALAAWKLAGTGLAAVGISGLVVAVSNHVLGPGFTGRSASGVTGDAASCAHWLSQWPGVHTCAAAYTLEVSSDAVVLRIGAGLLGVALLLAYCLARRLLRGHGPGTAAPLAGWYPLLAAGVFGVGALSLALAQLTRIGVTAGPGFLLSGAIVAAVAAAWHARKAGPAVRYLRRGLLRYARSR